MRCHICDKVLTEAEIQPMPDKKGYEPCSVCLEIALDTAYSDGFVREEPLDDPELQLLFGDGTVPILLDTDPLQSEFDFTSSLGIEA